MWPRRDLMDLLGTETPILQAPMAGAAGAAFERIRRERFHLSLGERDPSCAGVAAPVFGTLGRVVGALSLSGPKERFTEESIAVLRPLLAEAAKEISESLGGRYPSD